MNPFQPHPQFLHQWHRSFCVEGLSKDLVSVFVDKSIPNHSLAGFKGVSVSPKAAVEKPAYFENTWFQFMEQEIANELSAFLVYSRQSTVFPMQKSRRKQVVFSES